MKRISLLVCFLLGLALNALAQPGAPTVTTNSPICAGATLTFTATAPTGVTATGFTLAGPFTGSPLTNTTGTFSVTTATTLNSGAYTVTVTDATGTSTPAQVNAVVNAVPTITVSNPVTPADCITPGGSFDISGLDPAGTYTVLYTRNTVAGTPITGQTPNAAGVLTVTGLLSGSYTNIRVQTAASCVSNSGTATLNPPPPVTPVIAVVNNPVCRDATLLLNITNAPAGATYSWTGPGGYTSTTNPASRANYVPAFNGTYTARVTVGGCVSAAGTTTVTMTAPTAPPIRNNVTYCQFQPAVAMTVTSLGNAFVEWFDTCSGGPGCTNGIRSRGSTPQNANPPTPNTNVPGIVMWLARQTVQGGCPSAFDSVYVRVLPKPQPPVAATNTIYYCQYEVVGALSVGGINIRWFTTPTGGTGSTTAPIPSTLVPGTYNFYASQTTVDGCESDRAHLTVVIKPKPEPPGVTSPLNLCQGDAPQPLTALGQSLLWYTLPNGGVGVPVAPVISTSYEDSFFYYVTQTVNGCESDRALIASYIRYKPNGIITASSASVCEDGYDTFYYYGNGRPDAEYVWFAPLSSEFLSGQGTPGPIIIRFDTAGTSTVQLIVNNKGCISRLLAAPIIVRPLPVISFVNRQDACEDELVNIALRDIEPEITSYQWDFGPEATIVYGEVRTGGPFGVRYPSAGHYTVSAAATKAGCTSYPIVQDIYIHERPDATISYNYRLGTPLDQFCASDTLNLTVQSVPEGAKYVWTPLAYFQGKMDSLNNEVRAVVNMSSYVHVKVTNAFGCEATDSLYVPTKPCCGVYFPNAFTPNNDSRNDRFLPITNGIHRINNFRIMNRWGQVIWEAKNERLGWDGTYNGVPQDMGTYYFYINYRCEDKNVEDHGEFILIR